MAVNVSLKLTVISRKVWILGLEMQDFCTKEVHFMEPVHFRSFNKKNKYLMKII